MADVQFPVGAMPTCWLHGLWVGCALSLLLPLSAQCPAPATAVCARWGLDRVFGRRHSHVVIVEDDMLFSPGGWVGAVTWNCSNSRTGSGHANKAPPLPSLCPADFLLYFEATAPLLDSDPTLWCGSAGLLCT